jgi:catechol 2,3-dioxygenase-like lactoylglutathione lyase family enzyme
MAILGIHHFTLVVPDLARAVDYYTRVLGFVVASEMEIEASGAMAELTGLENPAAKGVFMKAGWGYMKLLQFDVPHPDHQYYWITPNKLGLRHFSLFTGDAMRFYERTKNDIHWHDEPAGHTVEEGNEAWADYGRDPFGNIIELWTQGPVDPQPHAPDVYPHPGIDGPEAAVHADVSQDVYGIHHAAVVFPDLEEGCAFYCELFGLEKVQYGPIEPTEYAERLCQLPKVEAIGWELRSSWLYLETWEFKNPVHPEPQDPDRPYNKLGISSITFMVDDCQAEYERLQGKVKFNSGPVAAGDGWLCMGRDPFGNYIELWQLAKSDPQPFVPALYPHGSAE